MTIAIVILAITNGIAIIGFKTIGIPKINGSLILNNEGINDNLPKYLLEKYKMTSLDFAIKNIHFPSGKRELELAINRLKFQELFTYSMKLLMLKKNLRTKNGIEFKLVSADGLDFKILKI